jgi:D-cysteine desulfhydrase
MNLSKFPRRRYTAGQTPIEKLGRLSESLGGPTLYMKRDDLLGLAGGGNKTRKLEFLVAEALTRGADTLITCGAIQSNHCRLTLAAAVKEGLKCRLVLEERVPGSYNPEAGGNNFLFQLLGVEKVKVVPGGTDMMQAMQDTADEVAAEGRKAYVIPGGGSNPIGATGYVACAQEILGTHAGLITGFHGTNSNLPVIGINVSRPKAEQEDLVYDLVKQTATHVGIASEIPREAILCFGDYVGPGYSLATDQMAEAVRMLARLEGILMDPVYTGKAMAGLIDLVRQGYFKREENVLFVHTGGSPVLHVYMSEILT